MEWRTIFPLFPLAPGQVQPDPYYVGKMIVIVSFQALLPTTGSHKGTHQRREYNSHPLLHLPDNGGLADDAHHGGELFVQRRQSHAVLLQGTSLNDIRKRDRGCPQKQMKGGISTSLDIKENQNRDDLKPR